MIVRIAQIVFDAGIIGTLYWLVTKGAYLLNRVDEIVDRQHGPTLPPEPAQVTVIDAEPDQPATQPMRRPAQPRPRPAPVPTVPDNVAVTVGQRAAEDHANGREHDVEFAEILAHHEHAWRESMAAIDAQNRPSWRKASA